MMQMQNQGAQTQQPQAQGIPQVTLGPPMGTTYFTNMYHMGGPVSATLHTNPEVTTQPAAMETPVLVAPPQEEMNQLTSPMLMPTQQPPQPVVNSNQSGQCSPSSDSNTALVSYGSNCSHEGTSGGSLAPHQGATNQDSFKPCDGKKQMDNCDAKTTTDKMQLPANPKDLSLDTTKETAERNCKDRNAPSSRKENGKQSSPSDHKPSEESGKTIEKDCATSPKINFVATTLGECVGDADGGGYQDSGCVSDVSSGVGDNLCSVLPPDDSTLGSEPQSPVGLLLEETDERSLLRSAHNSESSDTHSDSSSQHSLSNISSISTQSDVSVPSNKIMRAHTAKKGKYGVSANANLVRPLKDFPPRFQKIVSQNPSIRSEQFEGLALVRHSRQNKHLVVPPSPSTTDTSLSSSDEASQQTHHQFNPNAQSFVPHQNNTYTPQVNNGTPGAQSVPQDQSTYYPGFDPNVSPTATNVGVVNGSYVSYAPPSANANASYPPPPTPAQNVPTVSGDGSTVMYTADGSVCCGEGEEGESKQAVYYQTAPYQNAPTYTIHIISVPSSGPGAQSGDAAVATAQVNGTTTPASPTACANASALSSAPVGYQVPQQGDGMVYGSQQQQPATAMQYPPHGTVYYTNPPAATYTPQQPGVGVPPPPPAQQYNPYVAYPAPPNMVQGQVTMVASGSSTGPVAPPGTVVYSHPPPTPTMGAALPPAQQQQQQEQQACQQQQQQQQQQAAAAQFASMPPPPPPGATGATGPPPSVQPPTQYNSQPVVNSQLQVFAYST